MSKLGKQKFERVTRDFYPTGIKPLETLSPYLKKDLTYCEPCAGSYDLVNNLKKIRPDIVCNAAYDIYPQDNQILQKSAIFITEDDIRNVDMFITNPPFKWDMFEPITEHLISLRPTWLLIPSDYMHNIRMGGLMKKCEMIVSIGRVKWFADSAATSTDNFCWYLFGKSPCVTKFIGR